MYNNTFCDNCGCGLGGGNSMDPCGSAVVYPALPTSLSSVNAGESAVLCVECDSELEANYTT